MSSLHLYWALLALVGLERLAELRVSRRNAAWSLARGGVERGAEHYPVMVFLHTGLLVGCALEPWLLGRAFLPWLGWPMLALALGCQGLRWWVIRTLGPRWNTRVIIVPGLPRVDGGPFRFLRHPNYLAVVTEGLALPLIHTAWLTALVFSACNAVLLWVRIRVEERALSEMIAG